MYSHQEVGRAKDLSAPRYMVQLFLPRHTGI